jgi:hypothetical protein
MIVKGSRKLRQQKSQICEKGAHLLESHSLNDGSTAPSSFIGLPPVVEPTADVLRAFESSTSVVRMSR